MPKPLNPADHARAEGWTVGTILSGERTSVNGVPVGAALVARITAIGEERVLARTRPDSSQTWSSEHPIYFDARPWSVVDDDDL